MGGHLWLLGPPAGAISFGFSIEEVLLCEAQSFNGNFVLAPAVTRVQVLRSEKYFYNSING
jgi:hypothetical protein